MPYELPIELIVGIFGSLMFISMLIYKLNHGKKAIRLGRAKEGNCCE
jgi:iron complex transport system permease protein